MTTDEVKAKLDTKIWRTVGARFNAYRRYSAKQNFSNFTLAFLAVWNLALEVLPASFISAEHESLISPMSILVSVFLLVLSLLESSKGYELKAERLHNNAMELNEIYSDLQEVKTDEGLSLVRKKYHAALRACTENHSSEDSLLFQTEHPSIFKHKHGWRVCIRAYCYFRIYGFFLLLLLLPLLPFIL